MQQHEYWREREVQDSRVLSQVFNAINSSDDKPDNVQLDTLLGLPVFTYGFEPDPTGIYNRAYGEKGVYLGTPYHIVREILRVLAPTESDVVYDLGCGYGRLPFYGVLTTQARFKGVEILPHRVEMARRIAGKLGIRNVEFLLGSVLDFNFSDGTMFYMFNPFNSDTLIQVIEKLRAIARHHPIQVATLWMEDRGFANLPWLNETYAGQEESEHLRIFTSR